MGEPPQAGLHAADGDGDVGIGPAQHLGIDNRRPFGPSLGSAGRIQILFPGRLVGGIAVNHGIHIPAGHQKGQPRPSQGLIGPKIAEIGLAEKRHAVAQRLQIAPDERIGKGGMIHIGVRGYQNKIRLRNPPLLQVFLCHRQKITVHAFIIAGARESASRAQAKV